MDKEWFMILDWDNTTLNKHQRVITQEWYIQSVTLSDTQKIMILSTTTDQALTYWALVINALTHWGRVTHICIGNLAIICSDNGLSPGRRQAIIWTNAGISLIEPLGPNFCDIFIEIHTFSFKKMSAGKCRPFCFGLNVLKHLIRLSTLRPVANDLLNDALRLDNELSALAATCSLRSVSKVQINHLGLQNPL